jgi:hypothetical protein
MRRRKKKEKELVCGNSEVNKKREFGINVNGESTNTQVRNKKHQTKI